MPDAYEPAAAGFSDRLADAHEGFGFRARLGPPGPTPAEAFAASLNAGRLIPGFFGMQDPDMDEVLLFDDLPAGPLVGVDAAPGQGPPQAEVGRPAAPPRPARRPAVPAAPRRAPLAAAAAAFRQARDAEQGPASLIDRAVARAAGRRDADATPAGEVVRPAPAGPALDGASFVRQMRACLAAPPTERVELARNAWRDLELALAKVGGRAEGAAQGRGPTLMRLPAVAAGDAGDAPGAAGLPAAPRLHDIERFAAALARSEAATPPAWAGAGGPPGALAAAAAPPSDRPDGTLRGPTGGTAPGTPIGPAPPAYFEPPRIAADVARRLARSIDGRRLTRQLLAGGPRVHADRAPRGVQWASRAAADAPRGAIPKAGGTGPAAEVAGFDYQLLAAMDQWEAAYPGRAPYVTPREPGQADAAPADFREAAPAMRHRAHGPGGGGAPWSEPGRTVDARVAELLKEMGLLEGGRDPGEGGGVWAPGDGVAFQGGERGGLSMALIAPVMQVVQQVAAPLMKQPLEGAPGAGISPAEKGVEEADSEKLDAVAHEIVQRLRVMIHTEKDRRGY